MNYILVIIITTISYTANVTTEKIPVATKELCEVQAKELRQIDRPYGQHLETYCIEVKQ